MPRFAARSNAAIAAYEHGRISPSLSTLVRIIGAAGFSMELTLVRRVRERDGLPRGEELADVLALAEQFPARHAPQLTMPPFALRVVGHAGR